VDRRVAEHVLHVEREEEEHRQESGKGDQLRRVRGGEPLDPEDREWDEGVASARLVDHERRQQRERTRELADRPRFAPANVGCLHERVDEQQHSGGGEDPAERVEVRERLAWLVADQVEDRGEYEQADRGVYEQHPAPAGTGGQQTAEEHAGGRG
jgi:hypothetical protein